MAALRPVRRSTKPQQLSKHEGPRLGSNSILKLQTHFESEKLLFECEMSTLSEEVSELEKKVKEIERQRAQYSELMNSIAQQLTPENQIKEYWAQTESLKKDVNNLKDKFAQVIPDVMSKLDLRINSLQKQVQMWAGESKETRDMETHDVKQYLSCIASYFEQAICTHVLPEMFLDDEYATLRELLNYLNSDNEQLPEEVDVSETRQRWETMCDKLELPNEWKTKTGEWKISDYTVPNILRAVELMKNRGVSVTCPEPIDLKYVEQNVLSVEKCMPLWQFKIVKEFIESLRGKI